jgi:hypothetical protein
VLTATPPSTVECPRCQLCLSGASSGRTADAIVALVRHAVAEHGAAGCGAAQPQVTFSAAGPLGPSADPASPPGALVDVLGPDVGTMLWLSCAHCGAFDLVV